LTSEVVKTHTHKKAKAIPYIWIIFIPALVFTNILPHNKGIRACGTVCANRKGLPTPMKGAKMYRGKLHRFWTFHDNQTVTCTRHKTRRVNMQSTVGTNGISEMEESSKRG
jgi:hypothetical protein